MPQIEIRPAQAGDIPLLVDIEHDFHSQYVWQIDVYNEDSHLSVSFREVRLPRAVKVGYPRRPDLLLEDWNRRSAVLVGVFEGEPVGYISLSEGLAPTTTWVTDLAVATNARRQGIASGLILAGQDWAAQHKNRRIMLEIQSKNFPAIRMAQKMGFEFCGYNDHYYTNQDIALFFAHYLR